MVMLKETSAATSKQALYEVGSVSHQNHPDYNPYNALHKQEKEYNS